MKPATLACLLGPMGIIARPCGGGRPQSSSTVSSIAVSVTATSSQPAPTSTVPTSTISTSTIPTSEVPTSAIPTSAIPTATSSAVPTVAPSAPASPSKSSSSSASPSATPSSSPGNGGSSNSIDALYRAKGKLYYGTAADSGTLSKAQNAAVINANFGQLTPENSMKWDAIQPTRGGFNFAGADALVDFAVKNGHSVRGHTLLWYQQLPSYVEAITDAAELQSVIENHISTVVGRYKGKIRAWDVVNEIFASDGTLRDCVFTRLLGEDVVRIAFEAARKADPDAVLYINDFHLESATSAKVTKGMFDHVSKWLAAGVPIDGIGIQGHLGGGNPTAAGMQAGLEKLAQTGVKELAITELDIVNAPVDEYVKVTNACLAVESCVGITTWGVSDADSWLSQQTPLLFDASYKPKAAYTAIVEALS
ncbi:glycoside hydrolase family 10 protein [Durotheca rogersii]|uniref:glycoside hydrolase family 10 protein n=1 Tax=Durotheca rogersii TaxID=419775 RepID=UPI00221EDEF6|nr:glycoside hydrolase family 10 protein [Durotheca rogersii]KAI5856215.1 glycoside hydrolase family 10 protein [Durotheca rogersii]